MSIHRPLFLLGLLGVTAALAAGCGGSGSSSGDSSGSDLGQGIVATVGTTKITQAQVDQLVKVREGQYKTRKQTFPAVGSPAYKQIQDAAVALLVQQAEFAQKAKELGITVTDKQVDDRLAQIKKQYFGGSEKRFQDALKAQGFPEALLREDQRGALISAALIKKAGSAVTVSNAEVKNYYDLHSQQYSTPQTRVVRHILVKTKAQADKLHTQLENGADFATLAKKFSQDPGTKSLGGELTITRGLTVKPFDSVAFALRTGQLSKPVHTTYGWHIIKAVKPAKPRQVTPLAKVEASIRQQLLQQKQSAAASKFVNNVTKEFCAGKLEFAKGFTPSPDPCAQTSSSK